jgi:ferric-dicitrate binding protein FerR (iron transport regulator)
MPKSTSGIEHLLCDDSFLSWFFKTDVRAIRRWDRWIADHPEELPQLEQAIDLLTFLSLKEEPVQPDQITRGEMALLERIRRMRGENPAEREHSLWVMPFYKKPWAARKAWVAAATVFILATGMVFLLKTHGRSKWHTAYGEVRIENLPDGSEVTANANSRISYSAGFMDGKDREVWLTGEAFFHVRKTPSNSRFIVHTGEFDIIVTGTRFNAVSREAKASVLLEEGSVLLHTGMEGDLQMKPGDFMEYDHGHLAKRVVRKDSVTAWKEHKLSFDSTPISVVAAIIKEQYGVDVRLEGEKIDSKTVSGIMPNDNLGVLLKALEATSEFKIMRRGDGVSIIQN